MGCCVWCWVIFSYFSVPPSLLSGRGTSSATVFVSLPPHPQPRKSTEQQLAAGARRGWPAPSPTLSCCFPEPARPLKKNPSRTREPRQRARSGGRRAARRRGEGPRANAPRRPADGDTAVAGAQLGRDPAHQSPPLQDAPLQPVPALPGRGGGKKGKASPIALPPAPPLPGSSGLGTSSWDCLRRGPRCAGKRLQRCQSWVLPRRERGWGGDGS